jgi:bifunctional DNA-binding transcriptional regulator/antitoxin component of YhaV-PrlF toxin-antitoxin module
MVKLQHNGRQYTITIPEELVRKLGWKKGDELFVQKEREKKIVYIEREEEQEDD